MADMEEQSKIFLRDIEKLKQLDLNANQTFVAQLLLALSAHARAAKIKKEKPLSELDFDDIVELVRGL